MRKTLYGLGPASKPQVRGGRGGSRSSDYSIASTLGARAGFGFSSKLEKDLAWTILLGRSERGRCGCSSPSNAALPKALVQPSRY